MADWLLAAWPERAGPVRDEQPRPEIPWAAYPLPISRVGQAHVVEIEFPADVAQSLGFSIVDPNAAGRTLPIGLDSGVYVSADSVEAMPALRKHRLVFWPRSALAAVAGDQSQATSAGIAYGKIRLLGPHSTTFSLNREADPQPIAAGLAVRRRAFRPDPGRLSRSAAVSRELFGQPGRRSVDQRQRADARRLVSRSTKGARD